MKDLRPYALKIVEVKGPYDRTDAPPEAWYYNNIRDREIHFTCEGSKGRMHYILRIAREGKP